MSPTHFTRTTGQPAEEAGLLTRFTRTTGQIEAEPLEVQPFLPP